MLGVWAERWVERRWNVALSHCTVWASGISRVAGDGVAVEGLRVSSGAVICSCGYEWWGLCVRWAVVQSRVVCGLLVIVAPLGDSMTVYVFVAVAGVA